MAVAASTTVLDFKGLQLSGRNGRTAARPLSRRGGRPHVALAARRSIARQPGARSSAAASAAAPAVSTEPRHAAARPGGPVAAGRDVASVTAERQQIFNNIAPMYDQLNDWLSLGQHRIWKRMTASWSRAQGGDAALDICCGSGDLAFLLAEKVGPRGKVVGLDFAPQQLAVAAQRQRGSFRALKADMRWREGDALHLPFGDGEFDAATMGYGLRNVADIPACLREVARVLRPGKTAAILDFNNTTSQLVGGFQEVALANVVVPVARQFGMESEYEYLWPSIKRFPIGREQVRLALEAGFRHAVHYEIAGGLMGVLVATK